MDGPGYRWIIVATGGVLGCVAMGAMFSLPVFLQPIAHETGWSVTGASAAMSVGFVAMALASIGWGTLSDRFGSRPVVLAGAVLLAAGLALASRAQSLLAFQLTFGVLVGASSAAVFAPVMATVTGWFETNRSLAVSLVSAGMGMAPLTMSPLAAWLVSQHSWRASMSVIGVIVAMVMIPLSFLIRVPPVLTRRDLATAPADALLARVMTLGEAVRTRPFAILVATNFFCCATHSGPIFHTVSYAVTCGIPLMAAVSIYSIEGLAGLGGRIVFGVLGDRLGAKHVLVAGLLVQAGAALLYLGVRQLGGFYAAAALFGFIYAGVMPLYAVLARENFPVGIMGAVIGATATAGGLGMAFGPLVGGMIFDHFHSYAWLYVASAGLGLGAFLIGLTFRPFAPGEPQRVLA